MGRCPACVAAGTVLSGDLPLARGLRHKLCDTALALEQPRLTANSYQKPILKEEKDRYV